AGVDEQGPHGVVMIISAVDPDEEGGLCAIFRHCGLDSTQTGTRALFGLDARLSRIKRLNLDVRVLIVHRGHKVALARTYRQRMVVVVPGARPEEIKARCGDRSGVLKIIVARAHKVSAVINALRLFVRMVGNKRVVEVIIPGTWHASYCL